MIPPYLDEQPRRDRAMEVLALGLDAVSELSKTEWRVRSVSGRGFYRVQRTLKGWACECGDAIDRGLDCKHIWAVRIRYQPEKYAPRKSIEGGESRDPLRRDWPNYGASRRNEVLEFDALLWDLLQSVPEHERPVGRPGRPRTPFRTELFHAIEKVYSTRSNDWAWGELTRIHGSGYGLLEKVPNSSTPSRVFNRELTAGVLLRLVELSALPMKEIEDRGTVAIDSSGFSTTTRSTYNDQVHHTGFKRRFLKMHIIVGTRSHTILAIAVTDERGADYRQLIPLLQRVVDAGFSPTTFTADKAYLSREAYDFLEEHGIDGYIPFKSNTTGQARGSPEWHRKCHQFAFNRKGFEGKYHARSNVEATFGAIKRRLREGLHSKNEGAQFCEVLSKALCWNITTLIRLSYENRIDLPSPRPSAYFESLDVGADSAAS